MYYIFNLNLNVISSTKVLWKYLNSGLFIEEYYVVTSKLYVPLTFRK